MRDRLIEAGWSLVSLPLYAVSFVAIKLLDHWFQHSKT